MENEHGALEMTSGELSPLDQLRDEVSAWSADGASALASTVSELTPLLERSYLLGQPNLAGMGVGAWNLAVAEPSLALDPTVRARRMLKSSQGLAGVLGEAPEGPETPAPADLARAADLVESVSRLEQALAALPGEAPASLRERLASLKAGLTRRLSDEQRVIPGLAAVLGGQALTVEVAELLRAAATLTEDAPERPRLESVAGERPESPDALPRDFAKAQTGPDRGPDPELLKLAVALSRATGQSPEALLSAIRRGRRVAPEGPIAPPKAAAAPLTIGKVRIDGLSGRKAASSRALIESALSQVPALLERRLKDGQPLSGRGELSVALSLTGRGDGEAASLAEHLADSLVSAGLARIDTLKINATVSQEPELFSPNELLAQLALGSTERVAHALAGERRALDGTLMHRLETFFGQDLKDVMVFAGPMAGALARSLSAEALTHGKMVFFDPAHFRTDTAKGEALVAHELAHTRQEEDWGDARLKEAAALHAEAAYLDWLTPGGAPLAHDNPLDPTLPSAAAAADAPAGVYRATEGRETETGANKRDDQGPRTDTAVMEKRVEQVLESLRALVASHKDGEAQRTGRSGAFSGPF